jgi:hypothetical protein
MSNPLDYLDDDLQALGERLLQIGWARQIVRQPGVFDVIWTAKGTKAIRKVYHALRDLGDEHVPNGEVAALRVLAIMTATGRGSASE